jgi:hypothetical protein
VRLATLQRDIDRTIARYLRELERQDATSLTDPDSWPMMSGGGIEVCYNVQLKRVLNIVGVPPLLAALA